ncbi:hypothetical protein DFH27DRAFT_614708 [Peziza echinospora]|nr:hypothetical protein DFH27DRAFT_614708 [Peziza echinospora]
MGAAIAEHNILTRDSFDQQLAKRGIVIGEYLLNHKVVTSDTVATESAAIFLNKLAANVVITTTSLPDKLRANGVITTTSLPKELSAHKVVKKEELVTIIQLLQSFNSVIENQ